MAAEKDNVEELRAVLRELGQQVKVSVRMLDERESAGGGARSILETRTQLVVRLTRAATAKTTAAGAGPNPG